MPKRLSLAERLAADEKNLLLEDIVRTDDWSLFLVQQAVLMFGRRGTFSCNDLRDVLPELGHGFLGAAINALRTGGIIEHTGVMVPSTQVNTHGHRIAVWQLTPRGLAVVARRDLAARAEQRRAAA
ncbi:hypothetical protein [Streptomyces sp. NPDC048256]|uniref:hypothetical protein n=1 Tax=Streptomyces sp. NPDC048256 TaxID=3154613 RepID=UPI0033E62AF5